MLLIKDQYWSIREREKETQRKREWLCKWVPEEFKMAWPSIALSSKETGV